MGITASRLDEFEDEATSADGSFPRAAAPPSVAQATQTAAETQAQTQTQTPGGTKLFQFVRGTTAGRWELVSRAASPRFYDANEDQRSAKPEHFLEIEAGEIDARADQALQYVADRRALRVTFAAASKLWALHFPSLEAYDAFLAELQDKVFYNTYGVENDEKGRAKILGVGFKDRFFSAQPEEAAPMEVATAEAERPAPGEMQALKDRTTQAKSGKPIQGLLLGATDNSYLQRGTTFDVMRNVEGGVEDKGFSFTLTPLGGGGGGRGGASGGGGNEFTPGKVLMSQRETKMNLLSPSSPNTLLHANIEYGKVVSEWRIEKDGVEIPQRAIAANHKAAQLGDESTFLGLDANRLCRWDMRDRAGVVQEANSVLAYAGGKDYARGTNFSCMATSGDGHVVVGSADGKVRLYSSATLTQAKTSIPGLGKPITAVDVTYDGRWIVATTDDYLMVVKATYEDGRECSAFTSQAGAKLTLPRLLRLKPEDVLLTGGKKLKDGKFTWVTEPGRLERCILARVGKYVITWNFRSVKTATTTTWSLGGLPALLMDYQLHAKDEEVVTAGFVHDRFAPIAGGRWSGAAVVAATPHKLFSMVS